jgi:hypothetical protein
MGENLNKPVPQPEGRSSFCASPSCRPRLCLGLQSLGLAKKYSLLLLKISRSEEILDWGGVLF